MTIDRRLLDRLEKKLNLGRRAVYARIAERGQALMLPPEQAAIALALESKVSVTRIASTEDLADVRGAARAHPPTAVLATGPAPASARRAAARKKTVARSAKTARRATTKKGRKVFVVHGRDDDLRTSMFRFLRALKLEPIEWSEAVKRTRKGSPYVGEVLDKALKTASAIVVILSPDDQARLRKALAKPRDPAWETTLLGQARPNVLFEAGMAFGRYEDRTILVEVGELRPFSDVGGRHVIHLANGMEARQQLADRLDTAGCSVDTSGTDWFSEGDFGSL